jgi:hypothetical protein
MWGRVGRAHRPQKGHFYPEIKSEFMKNGVRAMELPPKGCLLSCQEPIHYRLQREIAQWKLPGHSRRDPTQPWRRLIGPQDFYELQQAASDVIARWRREAPMAKKARAQHSTVMQQHCQAGYSQRECGKYHAQLWQGSDIYQEVFNSVQAHREVTRQCVHSESSAQLHHSQSITTALT